MDTPCVPIFNDPQLMMQDLQNIYVGPAPTILILALIEELSHTCRLQSSPGSLILESKSWKGTHIFYLTNIQKDLILIEKNMTNV